MYGTSTGSSMHDPSPTITSGGEHLGLVRAFLKRFQGSARNSVRIGDDTYAVGDIFMRMLEPRELFRAQSFGDHYIIDRDYDGNFLTKSAQIKMAGNSVPPKMARALVEANYSARRAVAA
jgi:DNA (cytosine-5)-methyltransferase 1